MRKSIKRIVSSVLAASMVLTSCVVGNIVTATAVETNTVALSDTAGSGSVAGMPMVSAPTDSGNMQIPFGETLKGSEVTVKTVLNFDVAAKAGALLTVSYDNNGTTSDSKAKLRMDTSGNIAIDSARDIALGTLAAGVDNTIEFIINTNDGTFKVAVNGGTPVESDLYVDANLTKGVAGVKVSQGNGTDAQRTTTVKEVSWTGNEASSDTPAETTTEAATEATTEAPVETTTEAAETPSGSASGSVAGMPMVSAPTDSGNMQIPFGETLTGSEVTVKTVLNFDVAAKAGALLTVSYDNNGTTSDSKAKLRMDTSGNIAIDSARDIALGTLAAGVDNTIEFIINTNDGTFKVAVNGGTPVESDLYVDANLTKGVAGVKVSQGNGTDAQRTTTVKEVSWTGNEAGGSDPVETTTEVTTAAPVTEATTAEATTEATTEAPVTPAEGQVVIKPEYTVNGDELVVNYNATVNNAGFNNYTMFVEYDPSVLTPVSAADGNITMEAVDATGAPMTIAASNADNIEAQFENVPAANDTDFPGADGKLNQAQLGKVKVAYCVFDKDFSQAGAGSLPEFTTSGTLFTITYKINGNLNVTLDADVQVLNTVSSDTTILGTAQAVVDATVIGGGSGDDTTTEATTAATTEATTEAPSETTTEVIEPVTGLAIVGTEVQGEAGGTATMTFKLMNNIAGVASYDVFIYYNPTLITATDGTAPGFNHEWVDVKGQIDYVPTAEDPDYQGQDGVSLKADGIKSAADLGRIKLSVFTIDGAVTGDVDVLTIDFNIDEDLSADIEEIPVGIVIESIGDAEGNYYTSYEYRDGVIEIKGGDVPDDTTTEATTESPSEATTDDATEATTDATEVTTDGSTEATTSQVTTDATTETTTRRPSSGGGGGGGGGGRPQTTTTTEATTEATTEDTEAPEVEIGDTGSTIKPPTEKDPNFTGFTDLGNYPWAEDSINKLAELGIISGIGDGQYGPALPCRRGDFAILINRTLGVSASSMTKNFYDNEDQSKYYYNDVRVGYNAGILSGYGDNNYKPEQYCTREEMAVLIAKSYEWLGNDVTSTDLSVNNKYTDVDNISWWSAPYVAYLTDMGVLNGNTDGTLLPQNYINRAEMAVMMSKVYDYALDLYQSMTTTTTEATTEETTEDSTADSSEGTTADSAEETTVDESSTETTTEAATETTTVVDEDL